MSTQYTFQSGAIGDQLSLVCQTTAGAPVYLPAGGTFSMELQDPTGTVTAQSATFVTPNLIVFTTSAAFNFSLPGVWHAQGFVTQGSTSVSKTAPVAFTVNQSLA